MNERGKESQAVDQFILDQIDTVPHLEALLLLWRTRPNPWTAEKLAEPLYIKKEAARGILEDLARQRLISSADAHDAAYHYESNPGAHDQMMEALARVYRREIIRISNMIHSKAPSSVREFARAFRITKERN